MVHLINPIGHNKQSRIIWVVGKKCHQDSLRKKRPAVFVVIHCEQMKIYLIVNMGVVDLHILIVLWDASSIINKKGNRWRVLCAEPNGTIMQSKHYKKIQKNTGLRSKLLLRKRKSKFSERKLQTRVKKQVCRNNRMIEPFNVTVANEVSYTMQSTSALFAKRFRFASCVSR